MNKREKFKNLSIDSIKKWIPVNDSVSFSLLCISKCSLTYDSVRNKSILFGGSNSSGASENDTWEWDGHEWTQVANTGPAARRSHTLAYDSKEQRVVLFGGITNFALLNDTWEWDGHEWTQVTDTGPSPRQFHTMTYDEASQNVVLFGGSGRN